jgi:hypothetical protein
MKTISAEFPSEEQTDVHTRVYTQDQSTGPDWLQEDKINYEKKSLL